MVKFLEFASSVSLKNVKVEAQSEYHNDSTQTKASAPPWNFETPGIPKKFSKLQWNNFFKKLQICSIFSKTRLYHNYGSGNLLQIFWDNFWSYNFLLEVVPSVNLSQKLWHHTRKIKICWFQFISWFNFNSNRAGKFLPPPTSKVIIKKNWKKQNKKDLCVHKKLILMFARYST